MKISIFNNLWKSEKWFLHNSASNRIPFSGCKINIFLFIAHLTVKIYYYAAISMEHLSVAVFVL